MDVSDVLIKVGVMRVIHTLKPPPPECGQWHVPGE